MPLFLTRRAGVAVVEVHGTIGARVRVPTYERLLESVARNKHHRALLLDIDSPGGSASGSEALYRSLRRVADRKPVVAYVRGLGASGGYYLCCAAHKVVGLPTAMVGSIGVIYLRPILEQLLAKAGVEFSVFKAGRLKDMTGFWRGPTAEEGERFQGLIDEVYENFIAVVAQGRLMDESRVRELATGEVVTARRGQELGLIDELGDFNDALELAARQGNTRPRPLWVRPRRTLGQKLMGRMGGDAGFSMYHAQLQRLLAGGIYYLEPSHLLGDYLQHQE